MEDILQDVQARLLAEVPALKYVDEDWGQLDYYYPNPPVQWPCALIDATAATWGNTGKLQQLGLIQVKVRVGDLKLTNSSGKAPAGQKTAAFAIFTNVLKPIYKALHGYTNSDAYSALIRVSNTRIKRDDGVRIYELVFTTEYKDNSAMPVVTTVPKPTLRITAEKI
jgi:hypothetical protein